MIPMWMCPGCGPFSLRRPACALSFGAATWSHEVSTVVWIRGIPKWTLLLSHPPIFLAQDRWEDRWPNFQVTELLWFISSQFRDMSLSKFQFRAIHQESSWNFLGESLKHIMPWPCLFTFRTSTLCGSSFRHMCCHSSLCVHHAEKVSDRRRLKVWIGFNTIEICRFRRDLLVESPWVFVRSTVNQKNMIQTHYPCLVFFYNSHFLIAILSGTWFYPSPFLVGSSMFIPILSIQNSLHLLWLSSPFLMYKSTLSAGELPFWWINPYWLFSLKAPCHSHFC